MTGEANPKLCFDIEEAKRDKVCHNKLIHKLKQTNISMRTQDMALNNNEHVEQVDNYDDKQNSIRITRSKTKAMKKI